MNIKELIDYTRVEILDDNKRPYKWTNLGLITNLNRAYEELARDSWCIIDSETASVCRVPLYASQTLHSLSPKVLYVFNGATMESNGWPLPKRSEGLMSGMINWKNVEGTPQIIIMDSSRRRISVFPKFNSTGLWQGASNVSFVTATSTISLAAADFDDDLEAGDSFLISGTVSNNGVFTVSTVSATEIVTVEALVNESNVSAKIQLERDAAILRVARLPLVPYVEADLDLGTPPTPEIDSQWHYGLANGIAKYCFLKLLCTE